MRTIYNIYDNKPIAQKNHILTVSKEALEGDFKNDVQLLISYLWENPSVILTLLNKCPNKDFENILVVIIMNTFYENIFSTNILDETLLCIISILLKNEINNLKKKEVKEFLNDTICSNLLGELYRKPEVIKYFRNVTEGVVKIINDIPNIVNSSISNYVVNYKINMTVNQIEEQINQKMAEKEKFKKLRNRKQNNSFSVPENFVNMKFNDIERLRSDTNIKKIKKHNFYKGVSEKENKKSEVYDESYIKQYLDNTTKQVLIDLEKSTEDINMKEYIKYQLDKSKEFESNNCVNNVEGIYTNQTVLKNIYGSLVSAKILIVYQKYFAIAINCLNELLNKFLENINELPYSIRQICKIITILLEKKFPNLKTFKRNSYLGILVIERILFPLFFDPKINCLISKIDKEKDSYYNFSFLIMILLQFSYGDLFSQEIKNGNYTPFNGYFLEKMPMLMKIYDNIIDVEIPKYIEEILSIEKENEIEEKLNSIPKNYFQRHMDESLYHQSCCLSFGNLDFLLKLLNLCKDYIFDKNKNNKLKKILEKINNKKSYKDLLSLKIEKENTHPVMSSEKTIKEKKDIFKPTVEYFVINHVSFKDKYKYFSDINSNIMYVNLNDLDKNQNYDLDLLSRKALCEVLHNVPLLNELIKIKEINIESLNNFSLLIKDLHKYISSLIYMEPYSKKNMALQWSINFLLQNSKKFEENLKDNYSFIEDTEKEINSLIDTYKYDELSTCLSGFNTCQVKQELNEMSLLKLRKIDTNNIVTKIINQFPVYIKIETKEQITKTKENNINVKLNVDIRIAKSKEKKKIVDSKDIYVNEKHNFKIYKTIDSFTKFFDLIQDQKICQYTFDSKDNEGNSKDKKDIYDYIKNINLPERTTAFLNTTLKETVSDMLYTEKTNKTKIPSILTKINKKIIGEIYTQFKKYLPNEKDNELSLKTQSLSWTDINNFINDEYHLYDCIVSFIIKCLQKFENKKNVSGKINCIQKIKNILINIKNISTIKVGNFYLNPLLVYGIIKANLKYFASDIKFIETFIDLDDKDKINNISLIEELKCYINYVLDINYNSLIGNITLEEYKNKCDKCIIIE